MHVETAAYLQYITVQISTFSLQVFVCLFAPHPMDWSGSFNSYACTSDLCLVAAVLSAFFRVSAVCVCFERRRRFDLLIIPAGFFQLLIYFPAQYAASGMDL